MKYIETKGDTLDAAIESALQQLGLAREEVSRLLKDGTEVTALAREGTYMILIKGDGFAGWADIDLLTSEKPADS